MVIPPELTWSGVIATLLDWLAHPDAHLLALGQQHGGWVYALLFAIVFAETGLVVTPFLPGDSLLFISGALAANGAWPLALVMPLLMAAAVAGDAVNFAVGSWFGRRSETQRWRWPNPRHLRMTHDFFARHGGKTIFIARFVPIIRTLAPFVAGVGHMRYGRFAAYNVTGGLTWVGSLMLAGYLFGTVGWVKENLSLALLVIIAVSLLPGLIAWLKPDSRSN